jgi:hypothetical protein
MDRHASVVVVEYGDELEAGAERVEVLGGSWSERVSSHRARGDHNF